MWKDNNNGYLLTKYVQEVGMVSDVALYFVEVLQNRVRWWRDLNLHLADIV